MTEITVETDCHRVPPARFLATLVATPLITGIPAFVVIYPLILLDVAAYVAPLSLIVAFVAAATVAGAPTYLLFGGPAFYLALRKRGPAANLVLPALLANLASAPFVLAWYLVFEGADGGAVLPTLVFVALGCVFAPIWGYLFGVVYRRLGGLGVEARQ